MSTSQDRLVVVYLVLLKIDWRHDKSLILGRLKLAEHKLTSEVSGKTFHKRSPFFFRLCYVLVNENLLWCELVVGSLNLLSHNVDHFYFLSVENFLVGKPRAQIEDLAFNFVFRVNPYPWLRQRYLRELLLVIR